jgi:hypothetical protein
MMGLAGLPFGSVDASKIGKKEGNIKPAPSKYQEFMNAIHTAAFSNDALDEKTRLEWENIEGEVMAELISADMISGTAMIHIDDDPLFVFEDPETIIREWFIKQYVETINRNPYLIPSLTVVKQKLNELIISYQGRGRAELIQMLQSFQVSLQESEKNDALQKALLR